MESSWRIFYVFKFQLCPTLVWVLFKSNFAHKRFQWHFSGMKNLTHFKNYCIKCHETSTFFMKSVLEFVSLIFNSLWKHMQTYTRANAYTCFNPLRTELHSAWASLKILALVGETWWAVRGIGPMPLSNRLSWVELRKGDKKRGKQKDRQKKWPSG